MARPNHKCQPVAGQGNRIPRLSLTTPCRRRVARAKLLQVGALQVKSHPPPLQVRPLQARVLQVRVLQVRPHRRHNRLTPARMVVPNNRRREGQGSRIPRLSPTMPCLCRRRTARLPVPQVQGTQLKLHQVPVSQRRALPVQLRLRLNPLTPAHRAVHRRLIRNTRRRNPRRRMPPHKRHRKLHPQRPFRTPNRRIQLHNPPLRRG